MTTSVARAQALHRLDLMHVELLDPGALEDLLELLGKRRLEIAEARGARRDRVLVGDLPLVEILDLNLLEKLGDFHERSFVAGNGSRKTVSEGGEFIDLQDQPERARTAP